MVCECVSKKNEFFKQIVVASWLRIYSADTDALLSTFDDQIQCFCLTQDFASVRFRNLDCGLFNTVSTIMKYGPVFLAI